MKGLPRHRQRHLEASDADGEHPEGARRARVAVGAGHRRARPAEALHVHGVADPVARPGEPESKALARAVEEDVVVGVAEVGLQEVVVDVLHRDLRAHPVQVHGLQLEHDDGSGGVLGERLVDAEPDLGTRRHLPLDQVVSDQLLGDTAVSRYRAAHGVSLPELTIRD